LRTSNQDQWKWRQHVLNLLHSLYVDWAVQNRHLAVVKLLLEGIEDIDVLTQNGFGRGCVTEAFQVDDADICTFGRARLRIPTKRVMAKASALLMK
jgi:hypothetical protein